MVPVVTSFDAFGLVSHSRNFGEIWVGILKIKTVVLRPSTYFKEGEKLVHPAEITGEIKPNAYIMTTEQYQEFRKFPDVYALFRFQA